MQEIEIKFLGINPEELEQKILANGGKKISDEMLEEWIFKKPEWSGFHGRARVRTEGKNVSVAYKETTKKSSQGNTEIEFTVSDEKQAVEFIKKLGIPQVRHQQKRRIHYIIDTVSVDIDFWPQIPPFVEIEGNDIKSIEKVAKQLGFKMSEVCELDARQIIKEMYHVDVDTLTEYVF